MQQLDAEERNARLELLLKKDIPCIVFSCGGKVPQDLLNMADEHCVSVFSSNLVTVNLVNRATIILENEFADSTTVHGCMVDVRGVGVLITGESGIGKSEISLGLVERGSSLVADDMVRIRNSSGELIAASPKLSRGFIEIRGLGIINVTNLFGLKAFRHDKRVDLVINLCTGEQTELERLGLEHQTSTILGVEVEHLNLPVAPAVICAVWWRLPPWAVTYAAAGTTWQRSSTAASTAKSSAIPSIPNNHDTPQRYRRPLERHAPRV